VENTSKAPHAHYYALSATPPSCPRHSSVTKSEQAGSQKDEDQLATYTHPPAEQTSSRIVNSASAGPGAHCRVTWNVRYHSQRPRTNPRHPHYLSALTILLLVKARKLYLEERGRNDAATAAAAARFQLRRGDWWVRENAPQKSCRGCNAQGRVSRAEQSRVLSMADETELERRPEKVGRQLVSLGDMAHSMRVRRPGKVQRRKARDRRRGVVDAPVV
jgi:hypothetical protein